MIERESIDMRETAPTLIPKKRTVMIDRVRDIEMEIKMREPVEHGDVDKEMMDSQKRAGARERFG